MKTRAKLMLSLCLVLGWLAQAGRVSFCAFVVLRRGGWNVPLSNLITAGDKFLGRCKAVAAWGAAQGFRSDFLPGHLAVWGSVLGGRRSQRIDNLDFGDRDTVVLAAGDDLPADWDLYLENSDGVVLEKDEAPDSTPVIGCRPQPGQQYRVRLTNGLGEGGPSFAFCGVVQLYK